MLRKLWAYWKVIAETIGNVQARLILGLLYFVILGPLALLRRLTSDPLGLRRRAEATYWIPRPSTDATLELSRRQ